MKLPGRTASLDDLRDAITQLYRGRSLAVGTVTLRLNETTTTVTHETISPAAHVQLTPATSAAAAELAGGAMYVSAVAYGSFTITHASNGTADRTFNWHAPGG